MLISGVDEAGRGPVIGPLVLAYASVKKSKEEELLDIGVKDSKLLTVEEREDILPKVKDIVTEFDIISIEASELNKLMTWKSLNEIEAMKIGEVLNRVKTRPEVVYVDCPDTVPQNFNRRLMKYVSYRPMFKIEHKADMKYPIVSGASIIAKIFRDKCIEELGEKYSEYGDIGNGYPHDSNTIKFIENYLEKNKKLPDFIRTEWSTAKRLENNLFQQKLF